VYNVHKATHDKETNQIDHPQNGEEEKAKAMVSVAFSEQTCAQTNKTCVLGLKELS
jgi:hypothetical protein